LSLKARLEAALTPALAAAGLPGATALVVDADGVRAEAALGYAPDAVFELASMTKAIVSVAALQLVESGQLSLNEPLADLLPALAAPMVLERFEGDQPLLKPAKTPLTLKHLLTHTSGFGYSYVQADIVRMCGLAAPGTMASITMPLLFEPGTSWAYGVSHDWVGLAVAAASNMPLDKYLAAHVLGPLGMTKTRYGGTTVATMQRAEDGSLTPRMGFSMNRPHAEFVPGGAGLCSPAGDYGRFLRMLLNHGELDGQRLLSPAMAAAFAQNQVGTLPAGRLQTCLPWLNAGFDPAPGQRCGWGLGTAVHLQNGPNGRRAGSMSWAGIANTHFWVDPAAGLGAVLMMQLLPFGDAGALEVLKKFEQTIYAA